MLFDLTVGELVLPARRCFRAGLSTAQCVDRGLVIDQRFPLRLGREMIRFEPFTYKDQQYSFILTFENDVLTKAALASTGTAGDALAKQREYGVFLAQELGTPTIVQESGQIIEYR